MTAPTDDPALAHPDDPEHAPGPGFPFSGYDDHHHPLGSYAALATGFGIAFAGSTLALERSGRPLPAGGFSTRDLVLVGVATHKLTRLISRDRITQFLRAPFTEYQESAGHSEVDEAARGTGPRRVIGELLICPYCLAHWVASGFALGLVGAPRPTRMFAGILAAEALSDVLNVAYSEATK